MMDIQLCNQAHLALRYPDTRSSIGTVSIIGLDTHSRQLARRAYEYVSSESTIPMLMRNLGCKRDLGGNFRYRGLGETHLLD